MPTLSPAKFRATLRSRFGGVLSRGGHNCFDGEACALECASAALGMSWTDDPADLRTFDFRPLNDAAGWSSKTLMTKHVAPLVPLYIGSLDWPEDRQRRVVEYIIRRTVNEIIAELPGLSDAARAKCRKARTMSECRAAARVSVHAANAAANAAAYADAAAAAYSAAAAAANAAAADPSSANAVMVQACQIWFDAAAETA